MMSRDRELDVEMMGGGWGLTIFLMSVTAMACVLGFDREALGVSFGMLSFELWRFIRILKFLRRI